MTENDEPWDPAGWHPSFRDGTVMFTVERTPPVAMCPTTFPEPHELGEFPMTCYRCHMYADS